MQALTLKRRADEEGRAAPLAAFEMFGTLRASINRRAVSIKSRKSRALLACLALTPHTSESRGRVAGLPWSENTDTRNRGSRCASS
jgi:DNA-binding SARP family transcriptional activator